MLSRTLLAALTIGSLLLAGCTSGSGDEKPDASRAPPDGTPLTNAKIRSLVTAFDDQPFLGGQGSPEHVWKWVTGDTFIGLHFDNTDPMKATALNWIVVGVKGVFCKEAQPGGGVDAGFTHFHKATSASWAAGHGGSAGDQGYWLLHVAARGFNAPWGPVTEGTDHQFMHTDPPTCGATVPEVEIAGLTQDNGLAHDEIEALVAAFADMPMQGGQDTPEHVWKWVTKDSFVFLHFNHGDPEMATALNWFGVGVAGRFCADAQPDDARDFTHFHKWAAKTWDAGHGGSPGDGGYWLQHNAVRSFEAPWGMVEPGIDRAFGPTAPPEC